MRGAGPQAAREPFRGTFVGREADVEAVEARVNEGSRLVTLLGPGGVGKTRLVHRMRERLDTRFTSTLFCDLSSARTAGEVTSLVASSLGGIALGAATTGERAKRRVGAALEKRGACLLAADNLEQLDVTAIPLFAEWLADAPKLVILATSRMRLGIAGEVVHRVAPLASAEAMILFEERARAVGSGISAAERAAAARIVELLEGMPLALEMAATRLTVLRADELLERLSRPLAVLGSGARTDPDRHASLSRVLDGSWELLAPPERRALAELGVFASGFTTSAAEAVLSLETDAIVPALGRLVDCSLVRAVPSRSPRARQAPYEVVRDYALERLAEEGRVLDVRRRHAEHFAAWGESRLAAMDGRGDAAEAALAELVDDEANLAAAAASARADPELSTRLLVVLEPVRMLRGPLDAWIMELEAALAAVPPRLELRPRVARVELALARALHEAGRATEARAAYERAVTAGLESNDASLEGRALCGLGRLIAGLGEWSRALALFDQARSIPDVPHAVKALAEACYAFYGYESGVTKGGKSEVPAYLEVCRRGADPRELAFWLVQKGRDDSELQRDAASAERHFDEALSITRRLGDVRGEGFALFGVGTHRVGFGRYDEAIPFLRESARLLGEAGARRYEAWSVGFIGCAQAALAEWDEARARFDESTRLLREVGDAPREAHFVAYRGAVFARMDDESRAAADFEHARSLAPQASKYHAWTIDLCEAQIDVLRARAATTGGDASAHLAKARARLERAGWPRGGTSAMRDWPWGGEFYEPRLAATLLEAAIDDLASPRDALRVAADGASFALPGGVVISLGGRAKIRRVLVALASARSASPGVVLGAEAIAAAAWPGERVRRDAAQNRVHVALDTLRKVGLRDVIVRGDGGWLLDPAVPFAWLTSI